MFLDRLKEIIQTIRDDPSAAMSLVQPPAVAATSEALTESGQQGGKQTELDPKVRTHIC